VIEAAAGAFFQNTPFYPIAEMLRELLARRGDELAEEQLAQLESRLILARLKPDEAIPLIAPLLNVPLPVNYPSSALSPEQKGAGNEAEVFGDVPNIAARVQATAESGTVAITDTTHRLILGLDPLGQEGCVSSPW